MRLVSFGVGVRWTGPPPSVAGFALVVFGDGFEQVVSVEIGPERFSNVDLSVGEADDSKNLPDESGKDMAAMELGRKGGKARAKTLSKSRKIEIAKKAAKARWKQAS